MNNKHTDHPLSELIAEGEHQYLEFTESITENIEKEMVAFANAEGGTILIGVDDNGNIIGVSPTRRQLDRIQDFAYSCEPVVNVSTEIVDGIIVIEVEESNYKPVMCSSGSLIRKDATSRKMKASQIREMMEEWNPIEFDTRLCEKFVYPDDFSESLYQSWVENAFGGENYDPSEILPKMQAAEISDTGEMIFTNAAVLMFAKKPWRFFPK